MQGVPADSLKISCFGDLICVQILNSGAQTNTLFFGSIGHSSIWRNCVLELGTSSNIDPEIDGLFVRIGFQNAGPDYITHHHRGPRARIIYTTTGAEYLKLCCATVVVYMIRARTEWSSNIWSHRSRNWSSKRSNGTPNMPLEVLVTSGMRTTIVGVHEACSLRRGRDATPHGVFDNTLWRCHYGGAWEPAPSAWMCAWFLNGHTKSPQVHPSTILSSFPCKKRFMCYQVVPFGK